MRHPGTTSFPDTPASEPALDLIPRAALKSLQDRFALGQQRYGVKAWNSSSNQEALDNTEWVIDRLRHGIAHAALAILKLQDPSLDDGDDDAGAIMWAGALLAARRARERDENIPTNDHHGADPDRID